ncbi:unnamed protein product, partial [marine sediment metagenome]
MDNVVQGLAIFHYGRDIYHSSDISTAMTHKNTDPGFLFGE